LTDTWRDTEDQRADHPCPPRGLECHSRVLARRAEFYRIYRSACHRVYGRSRHRNNRRGPAGRRPDSREREKHCWVQSPKVFTVTIDRAQAAGRPEPRGGRPPLGGGARRHNRDREIGGRAAEHIGEHDHARPAVDVADGGNDILAPLFDIVIRTDGNRLDLLLRTTTCSNAARNSAARRPCVTSMIPITRRSPASWRRRPASNTRPRSASPPVCEPTNGLIYKWCQTANTIPFWCGSDHHCGWRPDRTACRLDRA